MKRKLLIAVALMAAGVGVWLLSSPRHEEARAPGRSQAASASAVTRLSTPLRIRPVATGRAPDQPKRPFPGAAAFRKYTDGFVEQQGETTKQHMEREKLTLEETKELTYFALTAMESQDWDVVADKVGHPISDEVKGQVSDAMMAHSREMARELREAVANGASEEDRWNLIDDVEQRYLSDYYRLTGMTDLLLDQVLLESIANQHANQLAAASTDNASPTPPSSGNGHFVRRRITMPGVQSDTNP